MFTVQICESCTICHVRLWIEGNNAKQLYDNQSSYLCSIFFLARISGQLFISTVHSFLPANPIPWYLYSSLICFFVHLCYLLESPTHQAPTVPPHARTFTRPSLTAFRFVWDRKNKDRFCGQLIFVCSHCPRACTCITYSSQYEYVSFIDWQRPKISINEWWA